MSWSDVRNYAIAGFLFLLSIPLYHFVMSRGSALSPAPVVVQAPPVVRYVAAVPAPQAEPERAIGAASPTPALGATRECLNGRLFEHPPGGGGVLVLDAAGRPQSCTGGVPVQLATRRPLASNERCSAGYVIQHGENGDVVSGQRCDGNSVL